MLNDVHPILRLMLLFPISLVVSLVGVMLESPGIVVAGMVLSGATLLSLWLLRALFGPGAVCSGEVVWRGDDDLEVYVGTCESCDRWHIRVRGAIVAHGRGFKDFHDAAEEIARRYEGHVPAIANEFRRLLAKLEEPPPPEEGVELERTL